MVDDRPARLILGLCKPTFGVRTSIDAERRQTGLLRTTIRSTTPTLLDRSLTCTTKSGRGYASVSREETID
jgi:hypothetical protein